MVKASALDHLVLVVDDVERSLAWYTGHLGLDEVRVAEWRAHEVPFPSLRVDDRTIIDFVPRDLTEPGGRGHLDHLCFVVTEAELEALRSSSDLTIEAEGERFGARGVAHSIYVTDPDGLTVEIRAYPS
jgi:catechol 2,3-dioxygenase-like lactoylglutathione lyase family enzyme